MKWVLLLFIGSAAQGAPARRARHRFGRQLFDHSTMAPINVLGRRLAEPRGDRTDGIYHVFKHFHALRLKAKGLRGRCRGGGAGDRPDRLV